MISYNGEAAFCSPALVVPKWAVYPHNIAAVNGILEDGQLQVMEPTEALLLEALKLLTEPTH